MTFLREVQTKYSGNLKEGVIYSQWREGSTFSGVSLGEQRMPGCTRCANEYEVTA